MKKTQLLICVAMSMVGISACTRTHISHTETDGSSGKQTALAQEWGIEVQQISLSAEGYMLDFRYQVVEPSHAKALMARDAECYVIDQKSGSKMMVPAPPKVGSLRQKPLEPMEGRIYYVMFANPGRRVQQGDKVTVVIGDLHLSDLMVQ